MISRRFLFLLACVILVALLLRLWGLAYDLPYIYHPDEAVPLSISQRMFKTGDLNPHFFHWPSLSIYLNLLVYVPYFLLGKVLGVFQTPRDIPDLVQVTMGVAYAPMPSTVVLGRLLTVGFGVGAVVLLCLIGWKLTDNYWVGLLAASFAAISPPTVEHSRWITPDMMATFFVLLATLASLLVFKQGKAWHYAMAGAAVGLAASTKYNGVLALLLLLLADFLRYRLGGHRGRKLYLALVMTVLAFFAATPFALLDSSKFLTDFRFDRAHYSIGHPGSEGDTLAWYLNYLWTVIGPVSLLAVLGIVYGFLSKSKEVILLTAFPIVYFAFISSFVVRNERTLLPLTPFLFLLASVLLRRFFHRIIELRAGGLRTALVVALSVVVTISLGIPLYRTVRYGVDLHHVDSRETARMWIDESLPWGAQVVVESYAPYVDPMHFEVLGVGRMIDFAPEWYRAEGFDYLVFGEDMFGRFYLDSERYAPEVSQYNRFFEEFELVRRFDDGGYEVRILKVPGQ